MTYICSCSGGKDSVATIILAHEKGYPLDEVIFSEVMFDENISGELPEHIDFINNVLKPKCEEWGYKFRILRANRTYMDCFHSIIKRSKVPERIGVFGWHISKLKIYAEPKRLREFWHCGVKLGARVSRPPQSWFYVEEV